MVFQVHSIAWSMFDLLLAFPLLVPITVLTKGGAMNINTSLNFNYAQLLAKMQPRIATGNDKDAASANSDFSLGVVDITVSASVEVSQTQTIEDVKREFYDYLDSLAISPGLSGTSISVRITDAAFEKMLVDPEYKQKMKDLCARDLCDPAWNKTAAMGIAPSASVIIIDADCEEEYLATTYGSAAAKGKTDGESFWSRRTKNDESARKAQEKRAQEKKEMFELLREKAAERQSWFEGLFSSDFFERGGTTVSSLASTRSEAAESVVAEADVPLRYA